MEENSTLFHPVEIGDDIFNLVIIIGYIHGIVELYVFGFELGLKDFESL